VGVREDFLDVILHRFTVDAHVARSTVIFCYCRGVHAGVFREGCQCVVTGYNRADVGILPNATGPVQGLIHLIGAFDVGRVSQINLTCLVVTHFGTCIAIIACRKYRQVEGLGANTLATTAADYSSLRSASEIGTIISLRRINGRVQGGL